MTPAVGQIEEAIQKLTDIPRIDLAPALKEFNELGQGRKGRLREATVSLTDLQRGYLLGLETARVLLSGMEEAVKYNIMI